MIVSRARPLLRLSSCAVNNLLKKSNNNQITQIFRNSGYMKYRDINAPDEFLKQISGPTTVLSAIVWWWILWRLAMEYEKFMGPKLPNPSEWTDEELGIPPLDEDP